MWLSDVAVDALVSPYDTHYSAVVVRAYEYNHQHIYVPSIPGTWYMIRDLF